jgi:O-methyltransferase
MRLITKKIRQVTRHLGFDVVRYNELPRDIDPEIASIVRDVREYTMTSAQRVAALCEAVKYIVDKQIEGDIVECGVWRGGSMMAVAKTLQWLGDSDRDLYLFDTFEGMTLPTENDVEFDGMAAKTLLASSDKSDTESVWCYAPLQGVKTVLSETGYEPGRMVFVQGRVEETLPESAPERIALLRLDTDWYESTRHELEHLYPRLVPGGVLIIDDYGHWQGARKAVDEYIAKHQLSLLLQRIDYSGRCAIKIK